MRRGSSCTSNTSGPLAIAPSGGAKLTSLRTAPSGKYKPPGESTCHKVPKGYTYPGVRPGLARALPIRLATGKRFRVGAVAHQVDWYLEHSGTPAREGGWCVSHWRFAKGVGASRTKCGWRQRAAELRLRNATWHEAMHISTMHGQL